MTTGRLRLRAAALMAVAAFALHELRYLVGYGSDAGHALERQGHAYLSLAGLLAGLLLGVAVAQLVAHVARVRRSGAVSSPHRSLGAAWAVASSGLLAVYSAQELLEGLLSPGHPAGLSAVLGNGGGWALPLALLFGAIVALALQGADAAVEVAVRAFRLALPRPAGQAAGRPLRLRSPVRRSLLGRHMAGRAPPLPC